MDEIPTRINLGGVRINLQQRINLLELELAKARSDLLYARQEITDAHTAAKHAALVCAEIRQQRDIYNQWNMEARTKIQELERKIMLLENTP